MHKYIGWAAAFAFIVMTSVCAAAVPPPPTSMREGGYVLAPFSFVKFCLDYPDDCPSSSRASRVALTPDLLEELDDVNRAANAAIIPTPDTSRLRYWRLDVEEGDCNIFAVQKRHELLARGWPAAALALTVVKTPGGEGHLIVTVRTDRGDLVLDNLRSAIVAWRQTGYQFIMRQSENNPQFWVDLRGGEPSQTFAAPRLGETDKLATLEGQSAQAHSAVFSVPSAPKTGRRALVAAAAPARGNLADGRMPIERPDETVSMLPMDSVRHAANNSLPVIVSAEADKVIADLTLWLLTAADLVVADLGRPLADNRSLVEPATVENTVAALASPVDPAAYGFM
jgi:predicted transglutaminase-like cysteine proteinase